MMHFEWTPPPDAGKIRPITSTRDDVNELGASTEIVSLMICPTFSPHFKSRYISEQQLVRQILLKDENAPTRTDQGSCVSSFIPSNLFLLELQSDLNLENQLWRLFTVCLLED